MPSHSERVRENYRCPVCGVVTLDPHVAHIMIELPKLETHYPNRCAVISGIRPDAHLGASEANGHR